MKKTIHICDRCKSEKVTSDGEKAGYRTIQIGISEIDRDCPCFGSTYNTNKRQLTRIYLCENCLNKLGIVNEHHYPKVKDEKSTSEQLLDLFMDLIQERMGEYQ